MSICFHGVSLVCTSMDERRCHHENYVDGADDDDANDLNGVDDGYVVVEDDDLVNHVDSRRIVSK